MKYKVTLNGRVYEVVVEKGEAVIEAEYEASAPVSNPPATTTAAVPASTPAPQAGNDAITAPFSGSVIRICKNAGDSVKKGDPVVIIEAMKMENEISAPSDGRISAVHVSAGQSVEKGAPLFSLN